jgi:hypothetical protein
VAPLNVDAFMDERAQQLLSTQPVINVNLRTIRVPVNTFRQTTKHNSNHNEPQTASIKAPTALDGTTLSVLSDSLGQKPAFRCHKFITDM